MSRPAGPRPSGPAAPHFAAERLEPRLPAGGMLAAGLGLNSPDVLADEDDAGDSLPALFAADDPTPATRTTAPAPPAPTSPQPTDAAADLLADATATPTRPKPGGGVTTSSESSCNVVFVSVSAVNGAHEETDGLAGYFSFSAGGSCSGSNMPSYVTIWYDLDGTSTPDWDYDGPLTGQSVMVPVGGTETVPFYAIDDLYVEGTETVEVRITDAFPFGGDAQVSISNGVATNSIEDNEPTVKVTATRFSATEGVAANSTVEFKVERTASFKKEITVPLSVGGTATEGTGPTGGDFDPAPRQVVLNAGQASATFTLGIRDDWAIEDYEHIEITPIQGAGFKVDPYAPGDSAEIYDDDTRTVIVEAEQITMGRSEQVTVRLSGTDNPEVGVPLEIVSFNPAVIQPSPLTATTGNDGTATFSVLGVAPGTSPLAVRDISGNYGSVNQEVATVWVGVQASDDEAAEHTLDPGQFMVTRGGDTTHAITAHFSVAGSATPGADYAPFGTTVTIPAGATYATLPVNPVNDNLAEGDEDVEVTIESSPDNPPTYRVYTRQSTAEVTIRDKEVTVGVYATDDEATEPTMADPVARDTAEFELRRSGSLSGSLSVYFNLRDSTAYPGPDYDFSPAPVGGGADLESYRWVTFGPGERTRKLTVLPRPDTEAEPTEYARVNLLADPNVGTGLPQPYVIVAATAVVKIDDEWVDADVDSDDNNGYSLPDRTQQEEQIEDDLIRIVKVIATNDDDHDADGIPGYADGYDLYSGDSGPTADDASPDRFVPIVVEVPDGLSPGAATLAFRYDASDPYDVVRQADETYVMPPGGMRIWTKDGSAARDGHGVRDGGNFVEAGVPYTLTELAFAQGQRTKTFYVEALRPSTTPTTHRIGVTLDGDGPSANVRRPTQDYIRLSAVDVDVLIGASDGNDRSIHDDWVGAAEGTRTHRILNFVRIDGPSNVTVTVTPNWTVPSGSAGSITIEQSGPVQVSTGTSGSGAASFTIAGQARSASTENIVLRVFRDGQPIGSETMTVVQFAAETETYGASPIPVNPAIVTSTADNHRGNLFAADTGVRQSSPGSNDWHQNSREGGAIKPGIHNSKKISPDKIEVVWGRVFNPAGVGLSTPWLRTSEEAGSGLVVNPADKGLANNPADNLRVRDDGSWISPAMENSALPVHYMLGHPTQSVLPTMSVQSNYAIKIESQLRRPISFPIAVHTMRLLNQAGTVIGQLNITPANVNSMVADLNTMWSQAGIEFTLSPGNRFEPQDTTFSNQFDVDDGLVGYSTDNVTAIRNVPNVIDIYFVRRIGTSSGVGEIAGTTIYEGMNSAKAGILVARETTGNNNSVQTRAFPDMARTLAHEMGHYLMKSGTHSTNPWNIMYVDSDTKLDISADANAANGDQAGDARGFTPVD